MNPVFFLLFTFVPLHLALLPSFHDHLPAVPVVPVPRKILVYGGESGKGAVLCFHIQIPQRITLSMQSITSITQKQLCMGEL